MGRYRARDLMLVPNLISLLRVPLAVAFALLVDSGVVALAIVLLAGISDVADGWYARRFNQATATGTIVDPITDKLFVGTVVVSLIATGRLELWAVPMLTAREIGELPLLVWWSGSQARRRARASQPRANVFGKLVTALQFVVVTLAIFDGPFLTVMVIITGIFGALAAVVYWKRELTATRQAQRSNEPDERLAGSSQVTSR